MSEHPKLELTQPAAIVIAGVIIAAAIVFVNEAIRKIPIYYANA